jgi:hypothetical protein
MKPNTAVQEINLTVLNSVGILVGLSIAAFFIYRTVPTPLRVIVGKNWALLLMLAIYIVIMFAGYQSNGVINALRATVRYGAAFMPLMILLCFVMGIGLVVTVWHEPTIVGWMQRHHIFGSFAAALFTPTSNAMIPSTESCWKVEMLKPYCLFFMQASALMSIPLFMLRATGFKLGSELPIRMWLTGFVVSVMMIIFAKQIYVVVEFLVPPTEWVLETGRRFLDYSWNHMAHYLGYARILFG